MLYKWCKHLNVNFDKTFVIDIYFKLRIDQDDIAE